MLWHIFDRGTCVVGFLHQVLACILCKTGFGTIFIHLAEKLTKEHQPIPKKIFQQMMRIIMAHSILKGFFFVFSCADI